MVAAEPHFLLFCDTHSRDNSNGPTYSREASQDRRSPGRWHFVLERLDSVLAGENRFEATDVEREASGERLALLSVVRGLEALEQPSKVTLVTTSRYVSRGLRFGLSSWQEKGYKWERFGVQMPIRNADLWQRIARALSFHGVTCRLIQSEASSGSIAALLEPEGQPDSAERASTTPSSWRPTGVVHEDLGSSAAPAWTSENRLAHQWQDLWWRLAAAWAKWWRGRSQHQAWLGS